MTPKTAFLLVSFMSLVTLQAMAQTFSYVRFHEPSLKLSGSGCMAGTYQATISPDWTALSVLFDQNSLELAGDFRASPVFGSPTRECSIDVFVAVRKGFRARALTVDYRGFSQIATGALGFVQTRVQYTPETTRRTVLAPDYIKTFEGPLQSDLNFRQTIALNKAPCGDSLRLSFHSSLKLENHNTQANDNSLISLDSSDSSLNPGLALRAEWEACR